MKVKDKSFLGKLIIVVIGFGLSVLKWLNIMPNATIREIGGVSYLDGQVLK